jgi:hypothetical protein
MNLRLRSREGMTEDRGLSSLDSLNGIWVQRDEGELEKTAREGGDQ